MNRRHRALFVALGVMLAFAAPAALAAFSGSGPAVTVGATFAATDGPAVAVGQDVNIESGNPVLDNNTVSLNTTAGNITVTSQGDSALRMESIAGTWTNISRADVSTAAATVNPEDKDAASLSGAVTGVSYKDTVSIDGSRPYLYYNSTGTGQVTVNGLAGSTGWAAASAAGDPLDYGTTSSGGSATIDVDSTSGSEEVVLFTNDAPVYSNMAPTGGEKFNRDTVELSVDLDDAQFSKSFGETITATWYVDGSSVHTDTVTSAGTLTYTTNTLSEGAHDYYVVLEDEFGGSTTTTTETFETVDFAPVMDNSSAAPTGGLSTETNNYTIDITDRDFNEPTGESVTAELYIDGSKQGEDTLTANGTATVEATVTEGGDHTYHWVATDGYGKTTKSKTFNISVPDVLYVYNETSPNQLVDNANATVSFYFDRDDREDLVVDRNASNGTVDLSGLPANEQFIAVVSADGYFNRRIYVQSLYDTQRIYMLNESVDAVQPTFQLTDFTGKYPLDAAVLEVQKNINGTWQTVEGDYFGATNQFSAVLQFNERHRLIIRNTRTGDSRDLGVITPVETSRVAVEVYQNSETVNVEVRPRATFEPSVGSVAAFESVNVSADVRSNADSFESYTLVASVNGTELANVSGTDPDGEVLSAQLDLSSHAGGTLNVTVEWVTESGETGSDSHTLYINEAYSGSSSLVSVLTGLGSGKTSGLAALMALFLTAVAIGGAATRMPSEAASGIGVLVFGGFMLLNWVETGWFFAVALTWLVFTAMRRPL